MSISQNSLRVLFEKYKAGLASPDEIRELFSMIQRGGNSSELQALLLEEIENTSPQEDYDTARWQQVFDRIDLSGNEDSIPTGKRYSTWWRYGAAAAIIILISFGLYRALDGGEVVKPVVVKSQKQELLPGGNKAMLTLADGSVIVLDAAKNGVITTQGGISVKKAADGQLVYDTRISSSDATEAKPGFNTISTPKGGQYQVVLPDGTIVWLNAASSVRFPTAFSDTERNVTLDGEAYFEVAKDKTRPFRVAVNGMTIEVLGTHFNVKAYDNEPDIKTTLVEGLVKVIRGSSMVLKPGEQAVAGTNTPIYVQNVNVDQQIAWKKGLFNFDNDSVYEVMRQISRWYDVDVIYQGKAPVRQITGKISRNVNASEVFNMLEFAGISLRVEGKKVFVKN